MCLLHLGPVRLVSASPTHASCWRSHITYTADKPERYRWNLCPACTVVAGGPHREVSKFPVDIPQWWDGDAEADAAVEGTWAAAVRKPEVLAPPAIGLWDCVPRAVAHKKKKKSSSDPYPVPTFDFDPGHREAAPVRGILKARSRTPVLSPPAPPLCGPLRPFRLAARQYKVRCSKVRQAID